MTNCILTSTASRTNSHFENALKHGVSQAEFDEICPDGIALSGESMLWALLNTGKSNNKTWDRINIGDEIAFFGNRKVTHHGIIAGKGINRRISDSLWGTDKEGRHWDLMLVITDLNVIDRVFDPVLLGNNPADRGQGTRIISPLTDAYDGFHQMIGIPRDDSDEWTEEEVTMMCAAFLMNTDSEEEILDIMAKSGNDGARRSPESVSRELDIIRLLHDGNADRSRLGSAAMLASEVLAEFKSDPLETFDRAERLFQERGVEFEHVFEGSDSEVEIIYGLVTDMEPGRERTRLIKERMNQNKLRKLVLKAYGGRCCITGIELESMLIASHIKPWSKSSKEEKTDINNTLCLNRFHDGLFDKHLMTITPDDGVIHYNSSVYNSVPESVRVTMLDAFREVPCVKGNTKMRKYLEGHNRIFVENGGTV
ncbi:MAG: HNH endonuclease signature motif containing protein [Thermoplasmata archaeon]|nr:HNH endonuclease signature motif containing protein [Thermoplasmata archaeon]